MGRGRQKAKHQKVARQLKYQPSTVDLSALERELGGDDDEYADDYGDYSAGHGGNGRDDSTESQSA